MVLDARPDRWDALGVRDSVTAHASGPIGDSGVRRPNSRGLWRTPWRCHRSGSCFGWSIGASRATRWSSARRRESSTWGGGYTRKREAGAGGEMEGRW